MNPSPESTRPQGVVSQKNLAKDIWLMFRKCVEQGTQIASVAPSSPFLSRMMCRGIDYDQAKCIVELGAGVGPITSVLLQNIKPHTRLIVLERDPDFCKRLRAKFPSAEIVEGDAAHLDQLLKDRGITHVDHVVSGLPLPSFPKELRDAILASSARCIGEEGTFRQITNIPYIYWKMYKKYFSEVKFKLVPLNFPPGGVYVCKGYKFPLEEKAAS